MYAMLATTFAGRAESSTNTSRGNKSSADTLIGAEEEEEDDEGAAGAPTPRTPRTEALPCACVGVNDDAGGDPACTCSPLTAAGDAMFVVAARRNVGEETGIAPEEGGEAAAAAAGTADGDALKAKGGM